MLNKNTLMTIVFALVAVALPVIIKAPYQQHILILVIIWATIGTAWNLLSGYAGQVSFGHAAFFGVGAYSAGLLTLHYGLSPWWGLALAR
ncbi:MAG: hypothetical protein RQM92_15340 [Candidatus Syntrophopropionicum ammoniitolerans]